MDKRLPPFLINPFDVPLNPEDDPLTVRVPPLCIMDLTQEGVALTRETRQWLIENDFDYACRVLHRTFVSRDVCDEFQKDYRATFGRSSYPNSLPLITFFDEKHVLAFKLRWSS